MTPLPDFLLVDVWQVLADERRATADLLSGLTADQWAAQSLCSDWTVKEVAVHLLPTTGNGLRELFWTVLKFRGNLHRASHAIVVKYAAEIAADRIAPTLHELADDRWEPPGVGAMGPYTDLLVHRLDVAVPLDIEVDRPAEPWRRSLDFLTSPKGRRGFVPGGMPSVTLRATDLDWTHGTGPMVTGSAAALGLTLCGRSAWLDRLDGAGADALRDWLQ
jgi:uncharacterized protein (TIGR03083 family)